MNGTAGSVRDQTVTWTSASGTSVSILRNTTGLGYNNQTESIATSTADGRTTDTVSNFAANGALTGRTVSTASANGLTKTVQTDVNGDGVFDQSQPRPPFTTPMAAPPSPPAIPTAQP